MRQLLPFIAAVSSVFTMTRVHAGEPLDVHVGVDVRAIATDSSDSFVNGGLGRTRFDAQHDDMRLGVAYLAARYRFNDTITLQGDVLSYGDGHGAGVDVSQLYLQWRPFPQGPWRWSAKLGAFYPGFSFEHRGPAWTPVYTLSASALNAWYGEELRAIGAEAEIRWLGASHGYQGDVAFVAGTYAWNDPIGVVVAARGWAVHDRQTGLFGYLSTPGYPDEKIREFREIDGRPGFYAGLEWRYADAIDVRAFRYDNRADPAAFNHVYAWLTRFNAVGARWQPDEHWTVISQVLRGETYIGPQSTWGSAWNMEAWFALASYQLGPWRWSARYEGFSTAQFKGLSGSEAALSDDHGQALTFSAIWSLSAHWQLATEWLQVRSEFGERQESGAAPRQVERQTQVALQYQWHL